LCGWHKENKHNFQLKTFHKNESTHGGGVGIKIKEQWINFIPQGQIFHDTFNIYNKFWNFLKQ